MPSPRVDRAAAARAIADFLRALGHDPEREPQLRGTGARVADLWSDELLAGERVDAASLFDGAMDAAPGAPLVVLDRLATHVVCPHHLTVGRGFASIAYLPGARLAGLGAIAALVDACASRLALQEDVGRDVARALVDHLGAKGAACKLQLRHGCLELHGPKKRGARVVTLSTAGSFDVDGPDRAAAVAALFDAAPPSTRPTKPRSSR